MWLAYPAHYSGLAGVSTPIPGPFSLMRLFDSVTTAPLAPMTSHPLALLTTMLRLSVTRAKPLLVDSTPTAVVVRSTVLRSSVTRESPPPAVCARAP